MSKPKHKDDKQVAVSRSRDSVPWWIGPAMAFAVMFGLIFLWLHYVGPRALVGYSERHQPVGVLGSAGIALFASVVVLLVAARKR